VLGNQQPIVGVPALRTHARPEAGRSHGVHRDATTVDQPPAGGDHSQREVAVLSVGAPEDLVELADVLEHFPTHCEVGRDPGRFGEARNVALPVGRPSVFGERNAYRCLHCADAFARVLVRLCKIAEQILVPCLPHDDVVVDEHDPGCRCPSQSRVACRCGTVPSRTNDLDRQSCIVHRHIEVVGRLWPIVDDDERSRFRIAHL
jgi:hypothetical protein